MTIEQPPPVTRSAEHGVRQRFDRPRRWGNPVERTSLSIPVTLTVDPGVAIHLDRDVALRSESTH
jgi:hypothetical protein